MDGDRWGIAGGTPIGTSNKEHIHSYEYINICLCVYVGIKEEKTSFS